MSEIRSVVVFCGSRPGRNPAWRAGAEELGQGLARAGIRLIYGGGRIGLMGAVADAVIGGGGQVVGIIPEFLTRREVAHDDVTDLIVTDSMHTRKRRMYDMADAFITMPGGLGTLDETVEVITWRQLGLHDKPVLICDIAGSAAPMLGAFDGMIEMGFAETSARRLYEVVSGVPALLERLEELTTAGGVASARL